MNINLQKNKKETKRLTRITYASIINTNKINTSNLIRYAIRKENPQIKSLHEAAEKLCNGIFWSNTIVREEISIQFKVFAENVKIQLRYKTDGFVYR